MIFTLLISGTGCAVYTGSARSGKESVVGIGRVTWRVARHTNHCASVASGVRLPGLVIGLSPEFFGLSVGYTIRENLTLISTNALPSLSARINGKLLPGEPQARWAFGEIRLRTPPGSHSRFATGRAMAGLSLAVEGGKPQFTGGLHSAQITSPRTDMVVELASSSFQWPFFDFATADISVDISVRNLNLNQQRTPP